MTDKITAQDVEDRFQKALKAYTDFLDNHLPKGTQPSAYQLIIEGNWERWSELLRLATSWLHVRERVQAGGDPLICVMERE